MIYRHCRIVFSFLLLVVASFYGIESQAANPTSLAFAKTDTVSGGTISSNTQWPSGLYYISSDLSIQEGATLTISSGAILKFHSGESLIVYGGLLADNVVFTSWSDDSYGGDSNGNGPSEGYPGEWPGLRFSSSTTHGTMSNCLVRFAGGYASGRYGGIAINGGDHTVDLNNVTVEHTSASGAAFDLETHGTVTGCIARDNLGFGYRLAADRVEEFSQNSNTQSSNAYQNHLRVYTSTISETSTWPNSESYYLESGLNIAAEATLTIASGVVMKFHSGESLIVYGGLLADNVVFTTWSDDSYGGDSNGNGASEGYPSEWPGLRFSSSTTHGTMSNCLVRFAGSYASGRYGGIAITGGDHSVDLSNVTVEHTSASGAAFDLSVPGAIVGCIARDNEGNAIKVTSSNTSISNTDIYSAESIGLEYTPADTLVAENCYWGHPSGPQHPDNPDGMGAVITGNVDFTPWSQVPNTLILDATIQGVVTDFSTGLPIDEAQVSLWPLFPGSDTIADESGAWSLSVPAGSGYDLTVTALGYNENLSSDLSFESGQVYQMDAQLTLITTEVNEENLPMVFDLRQNQPNPFNPKTTIRFSLPKSEHVVLRIYNAKGRLVKTLMDEVLPAGRNEAIWVADDDRGRNVASGVYLYLLETASETSTRLMTVIK